MFISGYKYFPFEIICFCYRDERWSLEHERWGAREKESKNQTKPTNQPNKQTKKQQSTELHAEWHYPMYRPIKVHQTILPTCLAEFNMNSRYYMNSGYMPTEWLRGKRGLFCSIRGMKGLLYLPVGKLATLVHSVFPKAMKSLVEKSKSRSWWC